MKLKFKDTFFYNFMSSGLGWIVAIIIVLLIVFHDCSRSKVVHMKEDTIYIKPNN